MAIHRTILVYILDTLFPEDLALDPFRVIYHSTPSRALSHRVNREDGAALRRTQNFDVLQFIERIHSGPLRYSTKAQR